MDLGEGDSLRGEHRGSSLYAVHRTRMIREDPSIRVDDRGIRVCREARQEDLDVVVVPQVVVARPHEPVAVAVLEHESKIVVGSKGLWLSNVTDSRVLPREPFADFAGAVRGRIVGYD